MNKAFVSVLIALSLILLGVQPAAAGWLQNLQSLNQGANNANNVLGTAKSIGGMIPKGKGKVKNAEEETDEAADEEATEEEVKPKKSKKKKSAANTPELTKTTNRIKGTWGDQVTCAGPNSATCQNGMDDIMNCMHQSRGYYYRLVADELAGKLETETNLSDDEYGALEEDIESVQAAIETDQVIDPDPDYPQRWLSWLTEEDQQRITSSNAKYSNEVRQDCDNRFGGMARYSK